MSMHNLQQAVRNAMRRKLLYVSGIDSSRIQLPNTAFHKPSSGIWVRESYNEGSEEPCSNAAGREFMVVNYEIFCKASMGVDSVDNAVYSICSFLSVNGEYSWLVRYSQPGQYAFIKSIDKPAGGIDSADPTWYRRLVAITVELYNP